MNIKQMSWTTKEYGDVYWSEDIHTTNCIMFRCHLFHFAYIHMYRSSPPIVCFNLLAVSHITLKNEPKSRKNLSTTGVNSCHFRFMNSRCAPKGNLLHLWFTASLLVGDLVIWGPTKSSGAQRFPLVSGVTLMHHPFESCLTWTCFNPNIRLVLCQLTLAFFG